MVLLGAFDPPTNAHVAMASAAASRGDAVALGMTRVQLDRPQPLLPFGVRLELISVIAAERGWRTLVFDAGTYVDVDAEARGMGLDPVFLIGSDKLAQLADPAFYPDGAAGAERTMRDVRFLVVPRPGHPVPAGLEVLDAFDDEATAGLSASQVRERLSRGQEVGGFVPPVVADRLAGYTRPVEA